VAPQPEAVDYRFTAEEAASIFLVKGFQAFVGIPRDRPGRLFLTFSLNMYRAVWRDRYSAVFTPSGTDKNLDCRSEIASNLDATQTDDGSASTSRRR
jgi:hypothetical protein